MIRTNALLLLLLAPASFAQVLGSTPRGLAVAHEGVLRLVAGGQTRWSVEGVGNATSIASDAHRVAVLDALASEAVIADLATGKATRVKTAETPIAAAFEAGELYVLARDARVLQHVGGRDTPVAADPAFLGTSNGRLYVYSRAAGTLQEIAGGRVVRAVDVAPFASDLEIAGATAYLAYPREAKIRVVSLAEMKTAGEVAVGAVPVDLALAGGGTALTARILAVADPSAKRVWMTESTQSTFQAFARGFLRGFIGLGLFGSRSSQFPTGVDRVARAGKHWAAYDSSSGTLYRFTARKSSVIAKGVAPGAWAVTPDGIAYWNDGVRVSRQ